MQHLFTPVDLSSSHTRSQGTIDGNAAVHGGGEQEEQGRGSHCEDHGQVHARVAGLLPFTHEVLCERRACQPLEHHGGDRNKAGGGHEVHQHA